MAEDTRRREFDDTIDHITRIVQKRDTLHIAASSAVDQLVESVRRCAPDLSRSEKVLIWRWSRTLGIRYATGEIAKALGENNSVLAHWNKSGIPEEKPYYSGTFPVGSQQGWVIHACRTKEDAAKLEVELIREHRPRYNKTHNPDYRPPPRGPGPHSVFAPDVDLEPCPF